MWITYPTIHVWFPVIIQPSFLWIDIQTLSTPTFSLVTDLVTARIFLKMLRDKRTKIENWLLLIKLCIWLTHARSMKLCYYQLNLKDNCFLWNPTSFTDKYFWIFGCLEVVCVCTCQHLGMHQFTVKIVNMENVYRVTLSSQFRFSLF